MAFLGSQITPMTQLKAIETYRNMVGSSPIPYGETDIEFNNVAGAPGVVGTGSNSSGSLKKDSASGGPVEVESSTQSLLSRLLKGRTKTDEESEVDYSYDETAAELDKKAKKKKMIIAGTIVGGALITTAIIVSVILVRRARRRGQARVQ